MQAATRYPLTLKMLTGLGRLWLAALILLILAPLINAFSLIYGIPLAAHLIGAATVAAIAIVGLGLPLSWGLAGAGLMLDCLARRKSKPKRKSKRAHKVEDWRLLAESRNWVAARRLAEPHQLRPVATSAAETSGRQPAHQLSCMAKPGS